MAAFPARDRGAFLAHWAKILADPAVLGPVDVPGFCPTTTWVRF
jgi:hypothetical protein